MVDSSSNAVRRTQNEFIEEPRRAAPAGLIRVPRANESAANGASFARSDIAANDAVFAPQVPKKPTSGMRNIFDNSAQRERLVAQANARAVRPRAGIQARDMNPVLGEGGAYAVGNKIGTSVANARNAVVNAPENARRAIENKQQEIGNKIRGVQRAVADAPAKINKAVTEKRAAIVQNVGARSGNRREAAGKERFKLSNARPKLSRPSSFREEAKNLRGNAKNMAVKGGPVLFWLVAGIAITKDLIDVFSLILDAVGMGLAATAIGAPVGVPIAIVSEIINKISGLFIDFTLIAYFGYIGGGFGLRLAIMSVGGIIDMIPGLNILPMTTVSFFLAYVFGRATKLAVGVLENSIIKAVGKVGSAVGGAVHMGGRFIRGAIR